MVIILPMDTTAKWYGQMVKLVDELGDPELGHQAVDYAIKRLAVGERAYLAEDNELYERLDTLVTLKYAEDEALSPHVSEDLQKTCEKLYAILERASDEWKPYMDDVVKTNVSGMYIERLTSAGAILRVETDDDNRYSRR